jgi:hypothetical protein
MAGIAVQVMWAGWCPRRDPASGTADVAGHPVALDQRRAADGCLASGRDHLHDTAGLVPSMMVVAGPLALSTVIALPRKSIRST